MGDAINIGAIEADLNVNSGNMVQGLANARRAIDAIQAEMQQLEKDFASNAITAAKYNERIAALDKAWSDLTAKMQAAHNHVDVANGGLDIMAKRADQARSSTNALSRGLMQLGYMADDVQYGFQAIVNNIAPLAQGIGQGLGMSAEASNRFGAAAQIAGVAAYQLYKRWDEVREAMGDTTPLQEAMRSLEGMTERLKTLKQEAATFSWGDQLAWLMGNNPDAGKAAQAAGLEPAVRLRREAESVARSMEGEKTDLQKKDAERWRDAALEAGGIDSLAEQLAKNDVAKGNLGRLLSPEKGPLAVAPRALTQMALGAIGIIPNPVTMQLAEIAGEIPDLPGQGSMRDEYNDLAAKKKAGTLSGKEKSRLADLEELARQKAVEDAKRRIGGAATNIDDQQMIGKEIGGDRGDVLAGHAPTKKQRAEIEKQLAENAKEDAKAEKDRVNLIDDLNKQGQENQRLGVEAQKQQDRKFLTDANAKAKAALPGLDHMADTMVAAANLAGGKSDDAKGQFIDKLKAAGLDGAEAEAVANDQFARSKDRINDRLNGMAGHDRERGQGEEDRPASRSEVYSASDLAHRVQSAIADKPPTKHESKVETSLGKMTGYLETLANKPFLTFEVK